jgi:REP element-mobilizing transposase RayT
MNNFLGIYGGNEAIAAYGMINKLTIFFLMPMFGIVQGFQPIAGFNFGARKYSRVRQVMKYTIIVCSLYGLFISIINITFSRQLLLMFGADEQVLKIAIPALRLLMSTMVFIGIQVTGSTYFQAIGDSIPAIIFGLSRQFFILIPILLILPPIFGLTGIWISSPIADIIGYCLLPNHYHLLIKIKPADQLIRIQKDERNRKSKVIMNMNTIVQKQFAGLHNSYAKAFNKRYNRRGSLFQVKPKSKPVLSMNVLLITLRYIHRNPLKHNFVDNLSKWPYSSFADYQQMNKLSLIKGDLILSQFESIEDFIAFTSMDIDDYENLT